MTDQLQLNINVNRFSVYRNIKQMFLLSHFKQQPKTMSGCSGRMHTDTRLMASCQICLPPYLFRPKHLAVIVSHAGLSGWVIFSRHGDRHRRVAASSFVVAFAHCSIQHHCSSAAASQLLSHKVFSSSLLSKISPSSASSSSPGSLLALFSCGGSVQMLAPAGLRGPCEDSEGWITSSSRSGPLAADPPQADERSAETIPAN